MTIFLIGDEEVTMDKPTDYYDERFVAFIDILGFSDVINKTTDSFAEYKKIKKVLDEIVGIWKDNYYGDVARYGVFRDVTVFSDSIVISYPLKNSIGGGLFHILVDLVHLCIHFLAKDIFIRGGVAYGKVYHDERICFGPAMISAYKLENEMAIFPRIIVDGLALKKGIQFPGIANTPEMEGEYIANLLMRDNDSLLYLDYLSQVQEFNDIYSYKEFIIRVKEYLEKHLSLNYSIKVRQKYLWFANYYNESVKKTFPELLLDEKTIRTL